MKKLITITIIALLIQSANAQQLHIEKTTVIGGKNGCNYMQLQPTPDGGVFWTGFTTDSTGVGDIPLCLPQTNKLKTIVGKIDSNGNKEWVRVYCDWNAQPTSGCPTLDNGYIMPSISADTPDIYLTKLDCMGKVQWQKRWGSSNSDQAWKVIENPDSSYIVLAYTIGDDGDIPFNYRPPNSIFNYSDIVLVKTDKYGNKEWLKIYGSSTSDGGRAIFLVDGYYYIIAYTDGYSHDHDFADTNPYPGNSTCYLMKINDTGKVVWSRSMGSLAVNDAIFDETDSAFVCVSVSATNVPPIYKNDGNSKYDFGVVKVNLEGQVIWGRHYGDAAYDDTPLGIAKGPGNTYLVLGNTLSEQFTAQPPRIGYIDGLIYWIDSAGNEIEHKYFGTTLIDNPQKITILNHGKKFLFTTTGDNINNPYTEGTWLYGAGVIDGPTFSVLDIWPTSVPQAPNTALNSLKLYPNPTDASITVELPDSKEVFALRIYNAEGKMITEYQSVKGAKTLEITTKAWANGNYIITCTGSNNIVTNARITIQH